MAMTGTDPGTWRSTFGLARLLTLALYLLVLTALALWLVWRSSLTHSWQAMLMLVATGLLIPAKSAVQHRLQPGDAMLRPGGLGQWLRDWAVSPSEPLATLPGALCEALHLRSAAVALPDGAGWRITHGHGVPALAGLTLADPAPGRDRFLGRLPAPCAGVEAGVRLILGDRPTAWVLLGSKHSGHPLTDVDLQIADLLLVAVTGLVGYTESQDRQRRTEAELQRLYDYVAALQQALQGQRFGEVAVHEVRSDLTLIIGHAELLLDGRYGAIDDRQRGHIAAIHRQADALTGMLSGRTAVIVGPTGDPGRL
jgi:hypothetical protein